MKPNKRRLSNVATIGALIAAMCLGVANAGAQEFFTSPEEAVDRLVAAVREGKSSRIVSVLGGSPSSRQIAEFRRSGRRRESAGNLHCGL